MKLSSCSTSMSITIPAIVAALLAALLTTTGCSGPTALVAGGEGLDTATIPADVQGDYQVFAHRCSKCHSLARALNSGIDDDVFWAHYVARMRRQPASGISREDEVMILRFLHYYSLDQKRTRAGTTSGALPGPAPTMASVPAQGRGAQ